MKSLRIASLLAVIVLVANAHAEISTFEQRVEVDGELLDYPRFSAIFTHYPNHQRDYGIVWIKDAILEIGPDESYRTEPGVALNAAAIHATGRVQPGDRNQNDPRYVALNLDIPNTAWSEPGVRVELGPEFLAAQAENLGDILTFYAIDAKFGGSLDGQMVQSWATVVPEPSSCLLMGIGALAMLRLRHHRACEDA